MKYTTIPKTRMKLELGKITKEPYDEDKCRENPSYFIYHYLNMLPYKYQHLILRRFRDIKEKKINNERIIVTKGRQMGLSFTFAWLAIWAAFYSKHDSGSGSDPE